MFEAVVVSDVCDFNFRKKIVIKDYKDTEEKQIWIKFGINKKPDLFNGEYKSSIYFSKVNNRLTKLALVTYKKINGRYTQIDSSITLFDGRGVLLLSRLYKGESAQLEFRINNTAALL